MGYRLGVDLGTTFSAAAIWQANSATIVELGTHSASIPSVLFLSADGEVVVGDAAEHLATTDPSRSLRHFKRQVGTPTPLYAGPVAIHPDKATSYVLSDILDKVTAREGAAPEHVVLTHPANWEQHKLDVLNQAARLSNLEPQSCSLVSEPIAAARHYATQSRVEVGDKVAVYDLGGGTFDAAVVQRTPKGFEILGKADGLEHRGGVDFDDVVMQIALGHLGVSMVNLDTADPAVISGIARLRNQCTQAKEVLSDAVSVPVRVDLPRHTSQVEITRGEFERSIEPLVADTMTMLASVIERSGTAPEELRSILLVGGSSRIPRVSEMLNSRFGIPIAVDVHPKHAVALGAATPETKAAVPVEHHAKDPEEPKPPREPSPSKNRNRLWILAATVGAIVVAITALVFTNGANNGPSPTTVSTEAASPTTSESTTTTSADVTLSTFALPASVTYANDLRRALSSGALAALSFLQDSPPSESRAAQTGRNLTDFECQDLLRELQSQYFDSNGPLYLEGAIDDLPVAPAGERDFAIALRSYADLVIQWYADCASGDAAEYGSGQPAFDAWCEAVAILDDVDAIEGGTPVECLG